jgi:hypothetical protein
MDEVTRTEIARLRWHLTALRFEHAMLRHYWALRSVKYDPDQPRVPAGNSDGGQWTGGHGGLFPLRAGSLLVLKRNVIFNIAETYSSAGWSDYLHVTLRHLCVMRVVWLEALFHR